MEVDNFQQAKSMLSITDVAKHILGEPVEASGNELFWFSQTHDEKTASLGANEEKQIISDFSSDETFGNGLDIFSFIVQLNNHPDSKKKHFVADREINNYDALLWLNNEFDLNLNLSQSTPAKVQIETRINKIYSLEQCDKISDELTDDIYAMFDTKEFKEKPKPNEIGGIKHRIENGLSAGSYNLKSLKEEITKGKTCIPAGIKSKNDWVNKESFYQIFMVDIDNVIRVNKQNTRITVDDERHVTVDDVVEYCKSINLEPTFIYYTFSHTEQQHKFRLVYVLEKPTQNQEDIEKIYEFLKETFKEFNMDISPTKISSLFLGGKKIAYESDKFYKIKVTEEVIEEKKEINENTQLMGLNETPEMQKLSKIFNSYLGKRDYAVSNGTLWCILSKDKIVPVSNFVTFVTDKITYINGRDTNIKYQMECHLLDNPNLKLQLILTDVDGYSKMNFIEGSSWDNFAIIKAGRLNTDRQKEVMKRISRYTMQEVTVYTNTGFERIYGNLCYLYNGGVIGDAQNVEVDLSGDGLQRYCFTDKNFDKILALKRCLSFIDVADYKITIPILCTIFLAPLISLLAEQDINVDYILFIQGKSGTRKSSLSAVALSFFGNFNRDTFPCSFRDTLNSIEKIAFILKDTVIVIDDFNPENIGTSKQALMERLFATFGDRVGRRRMTKDADIKEPYKSRGLCIVTGEMLPEVPQSRIARALTINIQNDSINLNKLTELQKNKEELAYSMMLYIRWVIDNENVIIEKAKSMFTEMQSNYNSKIHGRTNEISNVSMIGFTLFTQFLVDYEAISLEEKNQLDKLAKNTFTELVEEHSQYVEELKPTDLFYDIFEELLNSKSIKVINLQGNTKVFDFNNPTFVGYYDENKKVYYLFPDIVFNVVEKHYSNNSNKRFPVNSKTLWRYMAEEGLLERGKSYENQNRYTVPKIIDGQKSQFLPLKKRETKPGEFVETINRQTPKNSSNNNYINKF